MNEAWCNECDEPMRNCVCDEPFDPDDLPPEAFMTGICGGTGLYNCDCGGDICVCGVETIICEGCIDCRA